jgi:hypothetical protein
MHTLARKKALSCPGWSSEVIFSLVCANKEEDMSLDEFKPTVGALTLDASSVDAQQLELIFHALDDDSRKWLSKEELSICTMQ